MNNCDREWLFRELRSSLKLLAANGETALRALPSGCCKADELALDFDNFRSAVVGNFSAELPANLAEVLASVDAALGGIRGDGWTEEAVRSDRAWAAVREQAGKALSLLDRFDGKDQTNRSI